MYHRIKFSFDYIKSKFQLLYKQIFDNHNYMVLDLSIGPCFRLSDIGDLDYAMNY